MDPEHNSARLLSIARIDGTLALLETGLVSPGASGDALAAGRRAAAAAASRLRGRGAGLARPASAAVLHRGALGRGHTLVTLAGAHARPHVTRAGGADPHAAVARQRVADEPRVPIERRLGDRVGGGRPVGGRPVGEAEAVAAAT